MSEDHGSSVTRGERSDHAAAPVGSIALTFDDGPDATWTPRVLDALSAHHARATFFVIGPRAESHGELIARIADEGHEIGLHCDEHVRHSQRSGAWLAEDCDRALNRLAQLSVRPRRWRTPWGDTAPWTGELARERELELVAWTADTHDWRGDESGEMIDALRDEMIDGAVVLAHDGIGPGARRTGCANTVAFVHAAAALAGERDLELAGL